MRNDVHGYSFLFVFTLFFVLESGLCADNVQETENERPRNNIYLSGSDGSVYSINYERLIHVEPGLLIAGKIGIGINNLSLFSNELYYTLPHHLSCNVGWSRFFLEFGLGGALLYGDVWRHDTGPHKGLAYVPYPLVGIRLQPLIAEKVLFRLTVIFPLTGMEPDCISVLVMPVGISFGPTF